jgi:molybdate transport system substrate-binding protein
MKARNAAPIFLSPSSGRFEKGTPWRRLLTLLGLGLASALLLTAGCGRPKADPAPAPHEDKLVVFAAASLREAFAGLADEFKKSHAMATVTFNFAGTQEIRTQLEQGAPADVFASADERHMKALCEAGKVEAPTVFAENEPVIVVSSEQASTIRALADLPMAGRIVVGTPEVPIGKYTLQILDKASRTLGADFRARVEARVVSRELNVRQVLTKVNLGEADAGIVYRSDVSSAGDRISVVTIPPEVNVTAKYPIAVVVGAAHPGLAGEWVALAVSDKGQDILRRFGFKAPSIAEAAR